MRPTKTFAVVAATAVLLSTTGCRIDWTERVTGTMIGTGAGALAGGLIGSAVGSTAAGVALGAIAGGAAGYIVGDYMADKRERQCGCPPPAQAGAPCPCEPPPCALPRREETVCTVAPVRYDRVSLAQREYDLGRSAASADTALVHYDRARRMDPSRPEPWNARGVVLLSQGKRDEAKQAFSKALELDPSYGPAESNLRRASAAP